MFLLTYSCIIHPPIRPYYSFFFVPDIHKAGSKDDPRERQGGLNSESFEEDGMALEDQQVFQNFTFAEENSLLGGAAKQ